MPRMKETGVGLSFTVSVLIMSLLFIAAALIPIDSLWGFNHLKYFPEYVILIYILLLVALVISPTNSALARMSDRICTAFKTFPRGLQLSIVIALTAAVFFFLRVHVHSLGDGYQRIYQIEKGFTYYYSEPLDFFLHAVLYRLLKSIGIASGEWTYVLFSIAAGITFVSTLYLIRIKGDYGRQRAGLLKILIISFGGVQLFFGYVESYSLYYISGLLYIVFAAEFLAAGRGMLTISILLAVAMASHITAVFLLPSFVFLMIRHFKAGPRRFVDGYLPILIVLVTFLGLVTQEILLKIYRAEYVPSISGGLLPFFSSEKYSMFSPMHLYDVLNQILLIAPITFVLGVFILFNRKRNNHGEDLQIFSGIIFACSSLMLLVIDPKLGLARDWDLFSIPTAVMGTAVVLTALSRRAAADLPKRLKFLIGAAAVVFVSSWILTNASAGRQLKRAEDLLYLSDKGRGYSTELLAYYYRFVAGDSKKALQLLETIQGRERNARVYNKIAKMQIDLGELEEALKSIYKGLELDSNFAELHLLAGSTWLRLRKPEYALPHLQRAVILEPDRIESYQALANAYYNLDSFQIAIEVFKKILELNPDHDLSYFEIANIYRVTGEFDSAYVYVKKGLAINPNFPNGMTILGLIKQRNSNPTGK
jgi:Flp pilus assembly protein TadD